MAIFVISATASQQESSSVYTFGLGVYYSGRPNLQVGLFGATLRNLRPISGIVGAPGSSWLRPGGEGATHWAASP